MSSMFTQGHTELHHTFAICATGGESRGGTAGGVVYLGEWIVPRSFHHRVMHHLD